MSSPRLDDDPFSFDFLAVSFYFNFSDQLLAAFGFGDFLPTDCSLSSPCNANNLDSRTNIYGIPTHQTTPLPSWQIVSIVSCGNDTF